MPTPTTPLDKTDIANMPLTWRHYWLLAVSSAEQIIGAAIATIAGVILPLLKIVHHNDIDAFMQGLIGSGSLLGIAFGSMILGRLSDKHGYLFYFRLCPVLILGGAILGWLADSTGWLVLSLFIIGFGVGGGYDLDTDYISENMPRRVSLFMVGVAKATSSIGFFAAAAICFFILTAYPVADVWNWLLLIVGAMGALTFLARLHWANSPKWLVDKGKPKEALKAAKLLLGPDAQLPPQVAADKPQQVTPWSQMLRGKNLLKVIFTGISWACENVGVYGVGIFLPILVMALGLDVGTKDAHGVAKVINSVELTTIVNSFIVAGFIIGLLLFRHIKDVKMLYWGFWGTVAGLVVLLVAYLLHLPLWISVIGFFAFEASLNAGPHLVNFVLPAQVFDVANRGAGAGISAMCGKMGGIAGVFLMPVMLHIGGIVLVLIVCIAAMTVGAMAVHILAPKVMGAKA